MSPRRYGGYLVFNLTVPPAEEKSALAFVSSISPGSKLTYSLAGTMKFELPTSEITAAQVFNKMQDARQQMTVLDWAIASATLEEVFIKFARSIDIKGPEMGH